MSTQWKSNADIIPVNGSNGIIAITPSHLSTVNSTATPLRANETFTGEWEDILNYGMITVNVIASHDSAADGLEIQYSSDGINIDGLDNYTVLGAIGKTFSFQQSTKYLRILYKNGTSDQTYFRMQTSIKPYYVKPSSHRITDILVADDDAELVKSVLSGQDPTGIFQNVNTTVDGDLSISDNSSGLSIAKGRVTGTSYVHKFGNTPDFDSGDGIVTIWDGADDSNINQMQYVYSTTADIDSISSSSASDTFLLQIFGLDTNYNVVTQLKALQGRTRVALDTPLIRVYRMINVDVVDNVGHIYCYVNTALTLGIPADTTKVRAVMQPLNNQTLMALYTIPATKTGYMRNGYASISGTSKTTNYSVELRTRPFGGVFLLKHLSSLAIDGTSSYQHIYEDPSIIPAKTDIEVRVSLTAGGVSEASFSAGFDLVLVDN